MKYFQFSIKRRIEGQNKAEFSIKFEVQSIRKDKQAAAENDEQKNDAKVRVRSKTKSKHKSKRKGDHARKSIDSATTRKLAIKNMSRASTDGRLAPHIVLSLSPTS